MEPPQLATSDDRAYKLYHMYKRPEHLESPLSVPRDSKSIVYAMNDQTFHTPSFGDEEFDIPMIHGQHASTGVHSSHIQYTQLHSAPQVGMMNPAQDGLAPPGGAPSYQQPLYLQEPHTPVTSHSAAAPAGNYIIQQQPGGQRLLMMQPAASGAPAPAQPAPPVYGSPQRASPPGLTTSDDSDDSVPSQHSQLPGDAESLLPIHYCSASRQQQTTLHQMSVANMAVKRSSPEPIDNGVNRGQMQKKPKVQKKKKKRDPNEPQKPVSAYALFFRDTQAAIKGQNPNASFGEVSKIVASMWDGLDSDHKSVYKQKTEVAKKEYLKALAAYRASLVSKGGEQDNQAMYNHTNSGNPSYGNYYQGQAYGNGHSPQGYPPGAVPHGYSPSYPGQQGSGGYPGQPPQGYPPNPQQSPQTYPAAMPHNPQTYQGQPPQNYQVNPASSPQSCQPGMSQSPRSYQAQSPPNYPPNSGMSPPGYRQSPPIGSVHAMQYHHPPVSQQQMQQTHQQMQQAHQVQQYQQSQQGQQLQGQHIQQPQQMNPTQQMNHQMQQNQNQQIQQNQNQQMQQNQNQQMQQNQNQQVPQNQQSQQSQPQSQQQPAPQSQVKQEQHSPNNNGSAGVPHQPADKNENRSPPPCIRQGCPNAAIANSEWEDEYCSNECVVSHCRDVFSSWVASNNSNHNQIQNFSAVK